MSRLMRVLCVAALFAVVYFGFMQPPASAFTCNAQVSRNNNTGYGFCGSGFGLVRVYVECQSGSWPYVANIYGPWVYSSDPSQRSSATCPGGSWLTLVGVETWP